jgi:hypothetical protein
MRKGTFYKTSNGQPITLQQSHEYLERGCMSNPVSFRCAVHHAPAAFLRSVASSAVRLSQHAYAKPKIC